MSTAVPKEALRALISTLSGVPASRVVWSNEPEKTIGPIGGKAGKITLNVPAREPNGTLEPRRTYDSGTGVLTEEWGAHRQLTVSIRADNFLNSGEAFDTLEDVRLGLELPASRQSLRDAGLAFLDVPSIVNLDYSVDNRAVSSASMDLRVAQVVSKTTGAIPWIEKATSQPGPFTDVEAAALPVVDLDASGIEE